MSKNNLNKSEIDWKVDIDSFEGPLDLLLHLIKKNNLDIYDIPISYITSEYLKYLDIIKDLNLDNVGDFLIMASILMSIKSKILLPKQILAEGEIEDDEYKESSLFLKEQERVFEGVEPMHQYPVREFGHEVEATLFDVIDAFQNLIERAQKNVRDIITEEFTIEDKMRLIMAKVEKQGTITSEDIVDENSEVIEIVVTLLAILELVRTHQIRVYQKQRFGIVHIEGRDGEE
jgi:segregation and condensation protein A